MGNSPFNVTVVLFWLATMGWLVTAKVLPPLRVGDPPSYSSISAESEKDLPAWWAIRMGDRTVGWAANWYVRRPEGISEFYSRVYLAELPLDEIAPGWLTTVLKPVFSNLDLMDIDKQSWLVIDPLGRLSDFESRIRLAGVPDAIRLQGTVEGSKLKLLVRSGDVAATLYQPLAANSLMNDELSPQSRMPNLRVGQTWTVPLYTPFQSPHNPMDMLQATVETEEGIRWDGKRVPVRLVVYRGDPGSGRGSNEVRGRMWVNEAGLVLRQEVTVFRSPIQFERVPDEQATELRRRLPENWRQPMSNGLGRQLLGDLQSALSATNNIEDPSQDEILTQTPPTDLK
jgi:hypothetical protein